MDRTKQKRIIPVELEDNLENDNPEPLERHKKAIFMDLESYVNNYITGYNK